MNPSVVIVKGNPAAESFYTQLGELLKQHKYNVSYDPGLPHTEPKAADLWIGHSRGVDRLRWAPEATQTIRMGALDGINHGKDKAMLQGQVPNKYHFMLTNKMKRELISKLNKPKLLGSIEKNAAMWDKLLTKGLLGSQSIGRLATAIPSHLGQLTTNKSMLNVLNGVNASKPALADTIKGGLLSRLREQIGANRPPISIDMAFKKNYLSDMGGLQQYVNRLNGGKLPFKPTLINSPGQTVFKNSAKDLQGEVFGTYSPSYNGVQATDKTTLRHELGHFFTHQGMSPAKSLMLKQRILDRAKQYYPELIPPALQIDRAAIEMGKSPVVLEEAAAQSIAATGKSRAAQMFRQHDGQLINKRPQDIELIERANRIDPTGRDATVINHLLHNYGLNQMITR